MSKKCVTITLTAAVAVMIIISAVCLTSYYNSLIDVDSRASVLRAIELSENGKKNNGLFNAYQAEQKEYIHSIEYYLVIQDDYAALSYETRERNNIVVLKKSSLFKDKYKYYGGSSTTSSYGISKYEEHSKGTVEYVCVVSIVNKKDFNGADRIEFELIDDDTEASERIYENKINSTPYLDLYVETFSDDNDGEFYIQILDKDKNIAYQN